MACWRRLLLRLQDSFSQKKNEALFRNCFWARADEAWTYRGVESLRQIKLGWMQGYPMGPLESYIEKHKGTAAVQVLGGMNAFRRQITKLERRRIDAFMEDYNVGIYNLRKWDAEETVKVAGWIKELQTPGYIAFSPVRSRSQEYAKMMTAGMIELRKTGELQQILKKYGLRDWKNFTSVAQDVD